MPNCYNYNCDEDLGTHTPNDCGTVTPGGFKNLILLACNHTVTDPSVGSQITDAIAAGEAWLIQGVKAALPAGSPVEVDSNIANDPPVVTGYDYTGTIMDQNVNADNVTFYNLLYNNRRFGGIILHNADEDLVYWHDATIMFQGSPVLPDSKSEFTRFETSFKFFKKPNAVGPVIKTAPAGVFNT